MAYKEGDKVKVRCVDKDANAWKVDPGGDVEGVVSCVRADGSAFVVNADIKHDFLITVPPDKPKAQPKVDAPDKPNMGSTGKDVKP